MNRFGWTFLGLFVFGTAAIAAMSDFGGSSSSAVPAGSEQAADAIAPGMLVLPVAGVRFGDIRPAWGDARGGGTRAHTGTDIMAPGGTPVLAAASGTVEKLFFSNGGGGITAYVRSPDRRTLHYYAHLAAYVQGLREGQRVTAGQVIGYVGDTGNAGPGNTHLHFGVETVDPRGAWHQGRAVDPYPLLARGRARR